MKLLSHAKVLSAAHLSHIPTQTVQSHIAIFVLKLFPVEDCVECSTQFLHSRTPIQISKESFYQLQNVWKLGFLVYPSGMFSSFIDAM